MNNFANVSNGYYPDYTFKPTTTAVPYYQPQVTQYQPMYQNLQQNQQQQQPANNSGIIWVQGESGAKSYIVPPNTTVPLWDSENQVIYIKSVDSTGKPSMTILDYVNRDASQEEKKESAPPDYATKSELDELYKQVGKLSDRLNSFTSRNNNRKETRNNGKSSI